MTYAAAFAAHEGITTTSEREPVVQQRYLCRWIEYVRPDGYWPQPYSLEQAFETFRWMLERGLRSRSAEDWARPGVTELLSGQPTCRGLGRRVEPLDAVGDLRRRFHFALLSGHASARAVRWRKEHRVDINERRYLCFPHYRPFTGGPTAEAQFARTIRDVLSAYGARRTALGVQLNPYHADAVEVVDVRLALVQAHYSAATSSRPVPMAWALRLLYGMDRSIWTETVAVQGQRELFWDFILRGDAALRPLLLAEDDAREEG